MSYALLAYVAMWAILLAIGLVLALLGLHLGIGAGALLTECVFLSTLVPLWRRAKFGPRDLGLRAAPGGRATLLAFAGLFAYGAVSALWVQAVHPHAVSSNFKGISRVSTLSIVLAGFVACVGAPVAEEVFFRGFLYRSLRNRLSVPAACLIAATLFALVHTQYALSGKVVVLSFGLITCLLYERTGSLLPGIAIHSIVDGSGFERALNGRVGVVLGVYLLLAVILLARPPLRGLGRLLSGRSVFRDFASSEEETIDATATAPGVSPGWPEGRGSRARARRKWSRGGIVTVLVALIALCIAAVQFAPAHRTCAAAGINTEGGNEGVCVEGPPYSQTTVNVVDRARELHMPEYDVRIVASRVLGLQHEHAGVLVAYELAVKNTSSRPLQLGLGDLVPEQGDGRLGSRVRLLLPRSGNYPGKTCSPVLGLRGTPTPSLLQRAALLPGEAGLGWVTFLGPARPGLLRSKGADIDFYKVDFDSHYLGAIRLWK